MTSPGIESPVVAACHPGMVETPSVELNPAQIAILGNLLKAGFEFVPLQHVARYLPVQKNGFIAILDPSAGKLGIFGQVGYRIGEGMGVLVEKKQGKAFVWKTQSVDATPALLEDCERFKQELNELLQGLVQ
jgi:hypothetical protein